MKKLESSFLNMFLVLLAIALISGGALGTVYNITKAPIAEAKMAKQVKAIEQVVPGFTNQPSKEALNVNIDGEKVTIYPAKKDNKFIGAAVETFSKNGFSGLIKVMIGFDKEGNIINYSVLEHKETPGLGSKMNDWFRAGKGDINGKNPATTNMEVSKDGGDIDAITAATISSRAFLDAVNRGYKIYEEKIDSLKGATDMNE
ncbi:RnfABCDGE type electron transport complex subunit G [Saccharicrinis sp. FJH62]|uniref:RnfABCDGE type electron transport complex subunit G n=1 Tax=Saccharicrinis sp. FJH62 TaxID=3344657 RepID=UPI0035D4FAFA